MPAPSFVSTRAGHWCWGLAASTGPGRRSDSARWTRQLLRWLRSTGRRPKRWPNTPLRSAATWQWPQTRPSTPTSSSRSRWDSSICTRKMMRPGSVRCSRPAMPTWRFTTRHTANDTLEVARQLALKEPLYYGIVETTYQQAHLAHSQGQLQRAEAGCREGLAHIASRLAHPERGLPAIGCLNIALGCVYLEQDRLEAAERELTHGFEVIGYGTNPHPHMAACVALYRLCEIQGRPRGGPGFPHAAGRGVA